jgi:putative spermidine/putrescine transport system permease protein/mannopine transport system permease protein
VQLRGQRQRAGARALKIGPRGAWTATRFHRWLVWPPVLFVALFFVVPMVTLLVRSVTDPSAGFGNYHRVFFTGPYVRVLWLTIETATVVAVLCLLLAYPFAFAMSKARGSVVRIMGAMVLVALWTSVVIRSYGWMVVFQRRGVLNQALVATGLVDDAVNFIPGSLAVHVGMVHIMLPFMILPLLATMRSIDRSLLAAASVLGATPWAAFLKIFLPLSLPGVYAGCALVFMMSLGFFITPALLGGPRHTMAAVLIEQQANALLDWGLASALSAVLLVLTTFIYLVYLRITRNAGPGASHAR